MEAATATGRGGPGYYPRWDGPKRYGELKRTIQGVSDKVLIQQLKELEADRVLARTDYKEVPPRVDYALTSLGRSLADAIAPLCTWGTENMAEMVSVFAERSQVSVDDDAPPPSRQGLLDMIVPNLEGFASRGHGSGRLP
jgi:DNA-binding HxlR family transcriptional regulator